MLALRTLGSSSKGNCHILYDDNQAILLDCGMVYDIILKNLQDLNKDLAGVFITHIHNDHIKGAKDLSGYTQTCFYGNDEVYNNLNIHNHQKILVEEFQQYEVGNFIIIPFEVDHNAKNYNFMIYHKPTNTKTVYVTDAGNIKNIQFKDVDYMIIEANHDMEWYVNIPDEEKFKIERATSDEGHLNINQTIDGIELNYNVNLKKVILSHLSPGNYVENEFKFKVLERFNDLEVVELNPIAKTYQEVILKANDTEFNFDD